MYHGMMTVYKEKGYTSSDAVARLRGILKMRKIGHTGTLDPDAEGVLPMCLGNATRICELIADRDKEYLAVMRLGVRTDTQDMGGQVLARMEEDEVLMRLGGAARAGGMENPYRDTPFEMREGSEMAGTYADGGEAGIEARIRAACAAFVGEIDQVPPMYSAIKVNGKRLYDMARKGITVERKPRRVTIFSLVVEAIDLPLVTMRVRCSRGTYIRTLCDDIGRALGTGAAMQSLLRTRVGQFSLEEALPLDEVERIAKTEPARLSALIRPVDSFFADLPAAVCGEDALRLLRNGNPLEEGAVCIREAGRGAGACERLPGMEPGDEAVRVYDAQGHFYGLYRKKGGARLYKAYKMFLPDLR